MRFSPDVDNTKTVCLFVDHNIDIILLLFHLVLSIVFLYTEQKTSAKGTENAALQR